MADATTAGVFAGYRERQSHFSRRLVVVQQALQRAISGAPDGPVFVLDICGGEGQVLLPVVAAHSRRADVQAVIVELDAASVAAARARIGELGLTQVTALSGDAGLSDAYLGLPRAQVVVMSGVLAHLAPADRARAIRFLPGLCAANATFIWTIGNRFDPTRIRRVHRTVARNGVEVQRIEAVPRERGDRVRHEVGVGRVARSAEPAEGGARVFRFRVSLDKRYPRLRALVRRWRGSWRSR
ncbi:MAG: methyltransferase domain-containing protein [Vicinamibacterales bacterium]